MELSWGWMMYDPVEIDSVSKSSAALCVARLILDSSVAARPLSWPSAAVSPKVDCGLGKFQEARAGAANFWHSGAWRDLCRYNTVTYSVQSHNGWRIVAVCDACLDASEMGALDRRMSKVVFQ